jgi:hypothetical protein
MCGSKNLAKTSSSSLQEQNIMGHFICVEMLGADSNQIEKCQQFVYDGSIYQEAGKILAMNFT